MEKQRSKSRSKFIGRLLSLKNIFITVIFSLSICNVFSQQMLTTVLFKDLLIKPVGEEFLANEDIKFEVDIPEAKPSDIQIQQPIESTGISFKTMRSSLNTQEGSGTKIELWYRFSKKGTYTLKPLVIKINNIPKRIEFEPINIGYNPKEESPVIVVMFEDGTILSTDQDYPKIVQNVKVGEKLKFRVLSKYGIQLVSYSWDLPKDSIFVASKEYDIVEKKYTDSKNPEDLIPVFDFEWTALKEGEIQSPTFIITLKNFAGYKYDILVPNFTIHAVKGEIVNTEKTSSIFDNAFNYVKKETVVKEKVKITEEDCNKIVELRIKERLSMFDSDKRQKFEQSLGLPGDQAEFHLPLLYFSISLLIFFICLMLIFIKRNRKIRAIFSAVFVICLLVFTITFSNKAQKKHAISKNCELYSIPENSAESKSELPAGNYVKISEETDNWYYVELGENGGWCLKENLILIN